jgi:predicted Zn finger-like uncharacterized protein
MSLITRCPACRTMFRVVPDQLKISEGWVRCGKCDEIFDARAHMQDGSAPTAVPSTSNAASTVVETPRRRADAKRTSTPPVEAQTTRESMGSSAEVVTAPREPEWTANLPVSPPSKGRKEPVLDDEPTVIQADDFPVSELSEAEAWPPTTMWADGHEQATESVAAPEPAPVAKAAPLQELSFMRQARRKARWSGRGVRVVLGALSVALVLGLIVQLIVQERDRVVAREPGLRPLVEAVCGVFSCDVRPWRQIDALVIDSSAFSKVKGDLYRLSVTLKNNEAVDLAMPSVELALTDALDRPLIRRVIRPEELGVRDGVIRAAAEFETTVLLTVKTNGSSERIAGYRLFTFYP